MTKDLYNLKRILGTLNHVPVLKSLPIKFSQRSVPVLSVSQNLFTVRFFVDLLNACSCSLESCTSFKKIPLCSFPKISSSIISHSDSFTCKTFVYHFPGSKTNSNILIFCLYWRVGNEPRNLIKVECVEFITGETMRLLKWEFGWHWGRRK